MIQLGIITGVAFEAEILRPYRAGNMNVLCAGLRPNAAQAAAEMLIEQGASALLSFGIAGGLDAAAQPGRVVVASEIRGPNTFEADTAWTARLAALCGVTPAPLAHAPKVLATPGEKAAMLAATGAGAADMESYGVAETASDHGLPFAALRVVADGAYDRLPSVALKAVTPDGRVRLGASIAGALTHPWEIPDLIRLGKRTAAATEVLKGLARFSAGLFGLV